VTYRQRGALPSGSGSVHIDDIRLSQIDRPGADINYDDVVDFKDFAEFCESWLWQR
jgi:uncharacterized lipoprotein YbaY